ncbi:hypothetical protein ACFL23_04275 [Patescibacteria group bacterium]
MERLERLEVSAKEKLYNFLLSANYALNIAGNAVSISKPNTERKRTTKKFLGRLDFRENEGNATFEIFNKKDFERAKQIKKILQQFGISTKIFVEMI